MEGRTWKLPCSSFLAWVKCSHHQHEVLVDIGYNIVALPLPRGFAFCGFIYPLLTSVQNIKRKNSEINNSYVLIAAVSVARSIAVVLQCLCSSDPYFT